MKAKKRHQLETNVLADRIGQVVARVRPYASYLLAGVVLVVGWWVYNSIRGREAENRRRTAWSVLVDRSIGQRSDKLVEVAHEFSETPVRPLALLMAGDVAYAEGTEVCIRDYEAGQEKWRDALKRYGEVLDTPGATRQEKARAQLGIGRCHESLVQFSRARSAYETLVKSYAGTPQATEAEKRLKALADSSVVAKVFYGRLSAQKRVEPTPLPGSTTQPDRDAKGAPSDPTQPQGAKPG